MPFDFNALVEIGAWLKSERYHFITPTPATITLVNSRADRQLAQTFGGFFGWNRPAQANLFAPSRLEFLTAAGLIETLANGDIKARLRVSTLGNDLYFHSTFPTTEANSVFFGPDSYRFARFIEQELYRRKTPLYRISDIGTGTGVGAMVAARALVASPSLEMLLTDINSRALDLAKANFAIGGLVAETRQCNILDGINGKFDLILANPPYMIDAEKRQYRDGGDGFGTALSVQIVKAALKHLNTNGTLLLYTGAPFVDGADIIYQSVEQLLGHAKTVRYTMIDPDVFGEELAKPAYAKVERISAVGLSVTL